MDLKQLEYFVRVAELGSFSRAAIALDIAQPALSRQVRQLEVELRQPLLLRNGRGATPTEAGKLLLEHARGILHQVARARDALGRVRGALAGRVALGLPPTIARVLAVPLMRRFRERMPEAQLSISEGLSTSMQESLAAGRIDIALLYNAVASADVELVPLVQETLYLVEPRPQTNGKPIARTVSLADFAAMPLVIPSRPNAMRMLVESTLARQALRPNVALEVDGVSAILELVADGAGCAVLSRNAVRTSARPAAFHLRAIGHPRLRSQLSLAVSALRPSTLAQRATVELIQEIAQERLADD